MHLRRLSWAGVELTVGEWRLLIDPLQDTVPFRDFAGPPRGPLVPISIDANSAALVTHLHFDHCDRELLARLPRRRVVCHVPSAEVLAHDGVVVTALDLWQTMSIGPFRATPVPAQDWRGDDQVAWVVEGEGRRVIHCGDTIWHGRWYEIARRFGPFDVAFLPINGFIARLSGFTPTDVPGSLTPEQAIEAAAILEARTACAIHHTLFDNPPHYAQQPDAVARFIAAGSRRAIRAVAPEEGNDVPDA